MTALTRQHIAKVISALKSELGLPAAATPTASAPRQSASIHDFRGSSSAEMAKLKSALACISSDIPRGDGKILDSSGNPAPDYWLGVVWAIAREQWRDGEDIARDWSRQSPRYTDKGFDEAWGQFNPQHPNPIGIGSVFKLAAAKGWQHSPAPQAPAPTSRYKLLGRDEIAALPPVRWRLKKILPQTGIAAIFGPSGSGKSFLAFDLGAHIAEGRTWFGIKVDPCPVTYVMLEGAGGLGARVAAWEKHARRNLSPNFKAVVHQPFELNELVNVDELALSVPKGGVVIIDTLNRAAPTADENSSQDMGRILQGVKRLEAETGGLVILVHHTGKDASRGLRGHSSLHAALDAAIEVERKDAQRSWKVAKAKDGEDGKSEGFSLKVQSLGADADGDDITSCAIERSSGVVFMLPKAPSGKRQKEALAVIRQEIAASKVVNQCQSGPQTPCIKVADAVTAVAKGLATTRANKRNNEARAIIETLTLRGFLHSGIDAQGDECLWL